MHHQHGSSYQAGRREHWGAYAPSFQQVAYQLSIQGLEKKLAVAMVSSAVPGTCSPKNTKPIEHFAAFRRGSEIGIYAAQQDAGKTSNDLVFSRTVDNIATATMVPHLKVGSLTARDVVWAPEKVSPIRALRGETALVAFCAGCLRYLKLTFSRYLL